MKGLNIPLVSHMPCLEATKWDVYTILTCTKIIFAPLCHGHGSSQREMTRLG